MKFRIALIAHDKKKDDMIAMASEYKAFLSTCALVATGTTGGRLQNEVRMEVERKHSGPFGGDLQIGSLLVEGQIEGGIAMGLGMALEEEILFDDDGAQLNPNLTNYIIPTTLDMPRIDTEIVETHDPVGPFGAKGVGEPTLVPTAAAIANAIFDAVGVRITDLPATAEKVLMALRAGQDATTPRLAAGR